MAPGGQVYLRTDAAAYAQAAQRCFAQDGRWQTLPAGPWDFDHQTYFHTRALSQSGTEVFSLTFERAPL
jgi:tRNA G46 methylase TrmB